MEAKRDSAFPTMYTFCSWAAIATLRVGKQAKKKAPRRGDEAPEKGARVLGEQEGRATHHQEGG